jgi:hypothetical protein
MLVVIQRPTHHMVGYRDAERYLRGQIQRVFIWVDGRNRDPHFPIFPERSRSRGYSLTWLGESSRIYRAPMRIPPQSVIVGISQELPDLFDGRFHYG